MISVKRQRLDIHGVFCVLPTRPSHILRANYVVHATGQATAELGSGKARPSRTENPTILATFSNNSEIEVGANFEDNAAKPAKYIKDTAEPGRLFGYTRKAATQFHHSHSPAQAGKAASMAAGASKRSKLRTPAFFSSGEDRLRPPASHLASESVDTTVMATMLNGVPEAAPQKKPVAPTRQTDSLTPVHTPNLDASSPQYQQPGAQADAQPWALSVRSQDVRVTRHQGLGEVPILKHGLERVLQTEEVIWQKDPESGALAFDARLNQLPDPSELYMDRLSLFRKPSEDTALHALAHQEGCSHAGSSSSLTHPLERIIYLIGRNIAISRYDSLPSFQGARVTSVREHPVHLRIKPVGTLMTVDAMKEEDATFGFLETEDNEDDRGDLDAAAEEDPALRQARARLEILSNMGHIGEAVVTRDWEDLNHIYRNPPQELSGLPSSPNAAYTYSSIDGLMMRNQLDGRTLGPNGKLFDIKCRSVLPLRYDPLDRENSGFQYRIKELTGHHYSFEREMYDLIKRSLLRWVLQARMGAMDGFLIIHHNSKDVFGYKWLPLNQAETAVLTSPAHAKAIYATAVKILSHLLKHFTDLFRGHGYELYMPVSMPTQGDARQLEIYVRPSDPKVAATLVERSYRLLCPRTHFNRFTRGIEADIMITPLSADETRKFRKGDGNNRLAVQAYHSRGNLLPADVIANMQPEDYEKLRRHNQGDYSEGYITLCDGAFPLVPKIRYTSYASQSVGALRATGTLSPW